MRVLIACEFSGIVREAFAKRGHDTWSCDLLDTEIPGKHIKGDMFYMKNILEGGNWDLVIAHPPCTHLAVSGARWFVGKEKERWEAIKFFMKFVENDTVPKMAIENPVSIMSTVYRKPDQIIQPWHFGHLETKATCLWLKGLPPLKPTCVIEPDYNILKHRVHRMPPGPNRWKERSRTYQGIADAMAEQWGSL